MKLSPEKLEALRAVPATAGPNRVGIALHLAGERQNEVAEKTGLTYKQLGDIVRGFAKNVTIERGHLLADHLGCLIEDLFPRHDSAPPPREDARVPAGADVR
jgi:transcriptional regulator with XRE-family HTH domain